MEDKHKPLVWSPGGGLINPTIKDAKLNEPAPGTRPTQLSEPVQEPRWQIIISVIIVVIFLLLWLLPFLSGLYADRAMHDITNPSVNAPVIQQ